MFALVDGNNFYVSCERVFNPALDNKPVVVLSNNDGCIISRSNEAKALGLKMAEPVFKRMELIEKNKVAVFSSNYTLYGDLSNRMMKILSTFTPQVEVYSIDEAFLNLQGIQNISNEYATSIQNTIYKQIGIPVGVGLAPTKTLAKVANKIAKKSNGVFIIDTERLRDWAIRNTAIEDIWGIGRQHTKRLYDMGVKSAYDFTLLNSGWIRKNMSVVGVRIKEELLGNSCIPIELVIQPKKNIATTRAFGKKLSDLNIISEAVSTHAVRCAEKLRKQKSNTQYVTVFIHTDPFTDKEKYIYESTTISLPVASNTNYDLVKAALKGLKKLYRPGILYKKAGVIVSGLSPDNNIQTNLFESVNNSNQRDINRVVDALNIRYGRDKIKLAVQGSNPDWKLKQANLSQRFTTRWDELLIVKV